MHPLVPPLALGVIALVGTAILIGIGDDRKTVSRNPLPPPPRSIAYGGGKTLPIRKQPTGEPPPPPPPARPVVEPAPAPPAWFRRELGLSRPSAPLLRVVIPGFSVRLGGRSFVIRYRSARLSRTVTRLPPVGASHRFENGVSRRTRYGQSATVLRGSATTAYLLVTSHRGVRLWTWRLWTNLRPSVRADGALLLRGRYSFLVNAPTVYDAKGRAVTPKGLRWRLGRDGDAWRLSLRLDDSRLPVPYVISG